MAVRTFATSASSVNGKFVTYHDPGFFLITLSGGDLSATRAIVSDAVLALQKPLDAAAFASARAAFIYHIRSDLQTPSELADTFGWYAVEGNPDYAPSAGGFNGTYFRDARELTPDFVAATVSKYLGNTGATVTFSQKSKKP